MIACCVKKLKNLIFFLNVTWFDKKGKTSYTINRKKSATGNGPASYQVLK